MDIVAMIKIPADDLAKPPLRKMLRR